MENPGHEYFMACALQLARRGLYTTQPNPRVGCVVVKDGQIIGEGWHQRAGEGHAEVNALAAAGNAVGATLYVTLEPCSHQGRTPPCCEQVIDAGIGQVVAAMEDPNPQVAGRGFARLSEAGIEVISGVLETQARELNPGFIKRMESGLPWVRCKLAMSLDGRTAMASGESQWITGAAARADVQRLRARSSAIVTGIGTVLQDDPSLTVRAEQLGLENAEQIATQQPLRVVLDSSLQMPPNAKLLGLPGKVLIVTANKQVQPPANAEVMLLPGADGRIDLRRLLQNLAERESNEVLVEAGSALAGAFVQQGLVDELIVYMAPKLLGDAARPLLGLPGLEHMSDQIGLEITDLRSIGSDIRICAQLKRTE